MMRCKFCRKKITEDTKTCPYCNQKTDKKKKTWIYLGVLGLVAVTMWWFVFGGGVFTADLFYSDGFSIERDLERNIIPLSEMTIEIDYDFDATFVNRMNYYHGLSIGVFDGEIYSMLNNRQVKLISSDNLESNEIVYPTAERLRLDQMHIEDSVLYYTWLRGEFGRYDFGQSNEHVTIASNITAFVKFEDFALHRIHAWDFFRHQEFPRRDGNIYRLDLESGDSEVWLEDRTREFFVDIENDRILFAVRSNIFEIDLAGENRSLITDNFLHYNRLNPNMEYGWMYDGNRVFWINSRDWTGIESSVFAYNFATQEEEYLGRIPDASSVNVIDEYVLVNTTNGYLYLIDINAKHRRLLADDVFKFAVVGDLIIYLQFGTWNTFVMDLNGNVALFNIE